jgi:hypothetical protein
MKWSLPPKVTPRRQKGGGVVAMVVDGDSAGDLLIRLLVRCKCLYKLTASLMQFALWCTALV